MKLARRLWACGAATAVALAGAAFLLALGPAAAAQAEPAATRWYVDQDAASARPLAYWKFDDSASAPTTTLEFYLGAHGLMVNTPTLTTTLPASLSIPNFRALALNGSSQYVAITGAAASELDALGDTFSVAAWVRRATTGTYDILFDAGTQAGHWLFGIADTSQGNRLFFGERNIQEYYANTPILDLNWHHVAIVAQPNSPTNTVTFYLDGVNDGTVQVGVLSALNGEKRIGSLTTLVTGLFHGAIDELRLYDINLSAAEVGRLAQGRGCAYDGLAWGTAFAELECALDVAQSGDEIWVAEGVFRPGTNQSSRFLIPAGTAVMGGFLGGETSPSQRPAFDPHNPLTVLSGDVLGNDLPGFGNYGDNAFDVAAVPAGDPVLLERLGVRGSTLGRGLLNSGTLTLREAAFYENYTNFVSGGGLRNAGTLAATDVLFARNFGVTGGGLSNSGAAVLTRTEFISNAADNFAGGIDTTAPLTLVDSTLTQNSAEQGGGGMRATAPVTLVNSTLVENEAAQGAGLMALAGATLLNTDLLEHDPGPCSRLGAGAYVVGTLVMSGGVVAGNTTRACSGATAGVHMGGGMVVSGTALITGARFEHNRLMDEANTGGRDSGGGLYVTGTAHIANSQFIGNAVVGSFATRLAGGGLAVEGQEAYLTNTLFASNTVHSPFLPITLGVQLASSAAEAWVVHGTFAMPGAAINGPAVGALAGSLRLTNTLVTSHSVGVSATTGAQAVHAFTLFHAVTTPTLGTTANGPALAGDPRFVNPDAGDYHLGAGSAARNQGGLTPVLFDFEGDPRPLGTFADLGFDEFVDWRVLLPLLLR